MRWRQIYSKVGCVFAMVVVSILPHRAKWPSRRHTPLLNKSALTTPLVTLIFLPFLLFIFSPLGARWGQNYSIGTDYFHLGWIPRNFKILILKPKFSFLRKNHKNDIQGEFPDFYELTLYINFANFLKTVIPIMIIFVAKFKNHIRKIQESTLVIIFVPQKIGLENRNFSENQNFSDWANQILIIFENRV